VHRTQCPQWTPKRGCFRQKYQKSPQNNFEVKLIEIAGTVQISKKRVEHIVHEYLDMQKLCAKWLTSVLTIDQNQQLVDDSEQ
jgi:hypothetical protein